jgi:acyl-CoA reductase-like NAD-dependent aldehyde dehydrogenase
MLTVPLQINGKDVFTDKTFDVVNPSTGKVIHNSAAASLKEVELAVQVRISTPNLPVHKITIPRQSLNLLQRLTNLSCPQILSFYKSKPH